MSSSTAYISMNAYPKNKPTQPQSTLHNQSTLLITNNVLARLVLAVHVLNAHNRLNAERCPLKKKLSNDVVRMVWLAALTRARTPGTQASGLYQWSVSAPTIGLNGLTSPYMTLHGLTLLYAALHAVA